MREKRARLSLVRTVERSKGFRGRPHSPWPRTSTFPGEREPGNPPRRDSRCGSRLPRPSNLPTSFPIRSRLRSAWRSCPAWANPLGRRERASDAPLLASPPRICRRSPDSGPRPRLLLELFAWRLKPNRFSPDFPELGASQSYDLPDPFSGPQADMLTSTAPHLLPQQGLRARRWVVLESP